MTTADTLGADGVNWRWIADARLAALRVQALPDETRLEAVTIARTSMLALTAYITPIGHSPIEPARRLALDLSEPYPALESTALHCAALLFFFDVIEGKEYHNIGLPDEFWRFGDLLLSEVRFPRWPHFSTSQLRSDEKEAHMWLAARADRVRRALAAVAGDSPGASMSGHDDSWLV